MPKKTDQTPPIRRRAPRPDADGSPRPDTDREPRPDTDRSTRPGQGRTTSDAPAKGDGTYTEDLLDLDHRLVDILARRSRLMAEAASARRARGKALVDPMRERRLRAVWDRLVKDHGLDVRGVRRLLDMANALAYGLASASGKAMDRFTFRPLRGSANLEAPGPRSLTAARCWTALAASAAAPMTLEPAVINDPQVELVKALNQAGSDLAWSKAGVAATGGSPLAFNGKTIFVGSDELNWWLLLALSLPTPGVWTCTGSVALKALDMGPAARLLAGLGARLTSLEPYSLGLPVRTESGGLTTGRARLADDVPPLCALALALAAPTYPEGLVLEYGPDWPGADAMALAVDLLGQCGVQVESAQGRLAVSPGPLRVPPRPALALDPLLCAFVMTMPVLRGGRVLLDGRWPEADPLAVAVAGLLRSAGMEIDFSGGRVSAMAAGVRSIPVLDCAGRADLLPLAAALAASGSGEVRLINLPDDAEAPEALEAMHELLSRHERLASEDGEYLVIGPAGPDIDRERGPWAAPEPTWIMAAALAALHRSGLMLANPGDLSGLWPGFWTLYTSLFGGTAERAEPEEPEDDDRPKGRRIRL